MLSWTEGCRGSVSSTKLLLGTQFCRQFVRRKLQVESTKLKKESESKAELLWAEIQSREANAVPNLVLPQS